MPICPALNSFSTGAVISATEHNSNNTNLRDTLNTYAVLTDVARTISVTHTWTAAQTFTGGWTAAAACTISSGGLAVTGNSTITGTLGSLTGLTVASGGATITAGGLTVTAGGLTVTAGNVAISAGQASATRYNAGDSGATLTLDFNNGNIQRTKLTANCTFTLSNPVTGASYFIELLQDATGSRTVTWPATVKWEGGTAPTLTTTASRKDAFVLTWNGVAYLGVIYGLNFNETT
ncbi:MAG: hypothetical protein ACYC3L_01075 [Gemmatimonadaceae bacterium]